jgi:HlyD family secretion protein
VRLPRYRWSFGLSSASVIVSLALGSALALPRLKGRFPRDGSPPAKVITTPVRRGDVNVTLTSGGRVESVKRTLIECELQRLEVGVRGQSMAGGGASTILTVVPDGATVKKGEVLCELDSSDYVEMLRQQKMTVERARADHRSAELDLEIARMGVKEFKEGIQDEALKELSGTIALGEANWRKSDDRLKWARRMLVKGYVPASQIGIEELNAKRAEFALKQSRSELELFTRYSAPRYLRTLESQVLSAELMFNYQVRRLQRQVDRQETIEEQVAACTIRAPHDGFVIYVKEDNRPPNIEPGMSVRQNQKLFYLPDLSQMEALAMVHESMANRVRPGMRAQVRIEGLPDELLEGHVTSVAQLPTQNFFNEVRYFYTSVALDSVPEGLKPGMTAEIVIATDRRTDVLTIPSEAVSLEEGQEVCYVAHDDSLERRPIKVGPSNEGEFEVTEGLDEGERVVLNPTHFDTEIERISSFASADEDEDDAPEDGSAVPAEADAAIDVQ